MTTGIIGVCPDVISSLLGIAEEPVMWLSGIGLKVTAVSRYKPEFPHPHRGYAR